jgi:hypothetical protein
MRPKYLNINHVIQYRLLEEDQTGGSGKALWGRAQFHQNISDITFYFHCQAKIHVLKKWGQCCHRHLRQNYTQT